MILRWNNTDPLTSVAEWQGIGLTAQYRPQQRSWGIALTNAEAVADGAFTAGAWSTVRAAQLAVEVALENVIMSRHGHVQAKQRQASAAEVVNGAS